MDNDEELTDELNEELEEDEEKDPQSSNLKKKAVPTPIALTAAEQNRLSEILLYCYFNQIDEKVFGTAAFWNTIKGICDTFGIDGISISKSFRMLMVDTNRPTDLETWYLLDKTQHSVRQIRNISGIYWQKQKKLLEEIEHVGIPVVQPKINDPVMRKSIKDFVFAVYGICGIFQFTDAKTIQKALC